MAQTDARQSKSGKRKERVHVMIDAAWLKLIDRAASKLGISRSSFITQAAHAAATKDAPR